MKNSFGLPRQGSSSSFFLAAGCLLLAVEPKTGNSSTGFLLLGTKDPDDKLIAAIPDAGTGKLGRLKEGVP